MTPIGRYRDIKIYSDGLRYLADLNGRLEEVQRSIFESRDFMFYPSVNCATPYSSGFPSYMEEDLYSSPTRACVRTRHQDREIEELRGQLDKKIKEFESKEKKDKDELKDLIAYYYNKNGGNE